MKVSEYKRYEWKPVHSLPIISSNYICILFFNLYFTIHQRGRYKILVYHVHSEDGQILWPKHVRVTFI
jgi:hypothetical protein